MDDRRDVKRDGLPEASEAFERAILRGGEDIRRYERRRRRASWLPIAAAALALVALGLGAALRRLNAPKPDNTVLSVDPESVVTNEEKARLQASETPGPTQTPAPDEEKSRYDPNSGWEYLLDDGPFEAGEWLVLTDDDGCLAYGVYVPFMERPAEDARRVNAVAGMLVKYLGEAENGYARVEFAGQPGYVEAKRLRRGTGLPDLTDGSYELDEATLYLTDRWGNAHGQLILNADKGAVSAYALQKLLESLVPVDPADYADEVFSQVLVAQMWNPDDPTYGGHPDDPVRKLKALRFNLPRSGAFVLLAEDGRMYGAGEEDARLFWNIFDETYALISANGSD